MAAPAAMTVAFQVGISTRPSTQATASAPAVTRCHSASARKAAATSTRPRATFSTTATFAVFCAPSHGIRPKPATMVPTMAPSVFIA